MKRQKNSIVHTCWVIVITAGVLLFVGPAFGQYMVEPMVVELTPRPGELVKQQLRIHNDSEKEKQTVELSVVELGQSEDGVWEAIEPGSGLDTSKKFSCREWMKFDVNSIELRPVSIRPVSFTLRAPGGIRGFYSAAVLASMRYPPDSKGVALVVQYVVPILVQMQGTPVRQKVELSDVGLEFREATAENPATTFVSMGIVNNGGSYSRLRSLARVRRFSAGHWREVTKAEFKNVGIMPGHELRIRHDIEKSLPAGKYEVDGVVYVDGRLIKPLAKEIDFAGDPSVTKVGTDVSLYLEPPEVTVNAVPGGTRTEALKVYNASEDTINISTTFTIPSTLKGVAYGDLMGTDLSCVNWVKVVPEKFTVGPYESQSIGITAEMPNPSKMHPRYYASLNLHAAYGDGQKAGEKSAVICVANKNIEAKRLAQAMKLTVGATEGSRYVVVGRFNNIGTIHFTPKCRAIIAVPEGRSVKRAVLTGKSSAMLPLEVRDFSGIVDFSEIIAGVYRLEAILEYAPGESVTTQIPIRVSVRGARRYVEVIGIDEFEKIGVKWQGR